MYYVLRQQWKTSKINKMKTKPKYFKSLYKMFEYKTILAIEQNIPCKISVIHLYSHQDEIKGRANHSFPEQLDDLEDKVGDKYSRSPINRRVLYSPIVIYFDNLCTFINYQHHLRWLCSQQDANEYLKETYNWVIRTLADID